MSYIRLKKNYKVRKEAVGGIVFDIRHEKILGQIHKLPDLPLTLLRLSNGEYTKNDFIDLYQKAFSKTLEEATEAIEEFLRLYGKYVEFIPDKEIREDQFIDHKEFKHDLTYRAWQRLCAPLEIVLVLTYQCFCKCVYCYAKADHLKQVFLDTEVIFKILDDAKEMGLSTITISGGEPFLHKDIFAILERCIHNGFEVTVITKQILTSQEVKRLKEIGLRKIQVSLDSIDDMITEELTKVPGFATKMLATIQELVANDIEVTVDTVITKVNITSLKDLIIHLDTLGVRKNILSSYMRTLGRGEDRLFASEEEYDQLLASLKDVKTKMEFSLGKPCFDEEKILSLDNRQRCTGGRAGLIILPDGKTTICERLVDVEEFMVGNLYEQSLEEVWYSEELFKLIQPEREQFTGTDCYKCEDFERCVHDIGLCYLRSKKANGSYYNKDAFCPKNDSMTRFF